MTIAVHRNLSVLGQSAVASPLSESKTMVCGVSTPAQVHLLASALEQRALQRHADTDFAVGDITPLPAQASAASVPSSETASSESVDCRGSASPAAGSGDDDDDEVLSVPKIVAAGKGSGLYMPLIFQKIVDLSGKSCPNVVYIGTASFDAESNFKRHSGKFADLGCPVERINVSDLNDAAKATTVPSREDMRRLVVDWADVIVCSGGNTLHALVRWKEVGLDLLIKEAAERGAVLCGGSAGAGCWFNSMHSDSFRPDNVKHFDAVKSELDDEELADWVSTEL